MKKGFTLIETIIAIGILLIVIIGIVGVLQMNIKIAGKNSARVGAVSLINKRMEMLRNLEYDDIGTISGIPSGNIPQQENIVLNGLEYTLKTFIQYYDDPADGLDDGDENGITADYKKARIEVSWPGNYTAAPVVAVSDFMPKGIETIIGGGTLSVLVFDAQVQPISLANVHIINNEVDPPIDINVQTNDQGRIIFPGSPSIGEYQITITKDNYSIAQTYDVTPENPNPDPGHLTILEGQTTEASFIIDKTSSLVIETKSGEGYTLIYVEFDMIGSKTIGTDGGGSLIYKYSQEHISDINGRVSLNSLEWDIYDISSCMIDPTLYDISASSPPEPINIEPDTSNILTLYLVPHAPHTLLVTVKDDLGIISSASVRLYKAGYDETILTGETGQSFFTPLQSATDYTLEVSKEGYQDYLLEDVEVEDQTSININLTIP